jgi:hypothetical protein
MSVAEVRDRVAKARSTLDHTSAEVAVPFVVSALEAIVKALEGLENRIARLETQKK